MLFAGLTISALLCLASALPAVQLSGHAGRVEGEYIIVLKAPNADAAIYVSNTVSKLSGVVSGMSLINSFAALKSPTLHIRAPSEAAVRQAYSLPEVVVVEANVRTKMTMQCQSQNTVDLELWSLSRMSNSSTEYFYDAQGGNGVRVYVLDTGIRLTHNDFGGRATFGENTLGGNNLDIDGHGTNCAGLIMGSTFGVSKAAMTVAVKCLDDGGAGTQASVIAGIDFVVGDTGSGPKVINMALSMEASFALDTAVSSAVAAGITVVAPSGNYNEDACLRSPGRSTDVITVGSTNSNDNLEWYASFGPCIDFLAPGYLIYTSGNENDDDIAWKSGTSMACSYAAGAAANYLSANPDASPAEVKDYLISRAAKNEINLREGEFTPNLLLQQSCP